MATTAQQVFKKAMALVDEILDSGVINPTDTASYAAKTPDILDILQAELLKQGDIFGTYEIANKPISNLLGYGYGFDIQAYEGTELTFECAGSAKAYYFEVDRVGTVYIEDYTGSWNTLETIVTTSTPQGMSQYKGVVTPTSGATKARLRFTGEYYYRFVNLALFGIPFAIDADVPDYRPWVKKQMPADFKGVSEIINETPYQQYSKDAGYKWEGRKNLYISYYFDGNIRIVYKSIPTLIVNMNSVLQVDDITAITILPYGLASMLLLEENAAIASFFNEKYKEAKFEATKPPPAAFEAITNLYGGFE